MYTTLQSEPGLWTVGSYDPNGKWHAESDHGDRQEAQEQVAYLNGGPLPTSKQQLPDPADFEFQLIAALTVIGSSLKSIAQSLKKFNEREDGFVE